MKKSEAGKLGFLKSKDVLDFHQERRRQEAVDRWSARGKQCGFCNELIAYERRRSSYCNNSCSAKASNTKRATRTCPQCEKRVTGDRTYCDQNCYISYTKSDYIQRWLAGELSGATSNGTVSRRIKLWLIEIRGEECELCGWCQKHPVTGRVPIQVDHIDGNAENNELENLRLLCPNCHSLTPTFAALNRGKGRACRRASYRKKDDA
jgi:hypothetical protein